MSGAVQAQLLVSVTHTYGAFGSRHTYIVVPCVVAHAGGAAPNRAASTLHPISGISAAAFSGGGTNSRAGRRYCKDAVGWLLVVGGLAWGEGGLAVPSSQSCFDDIV